MNHSNHIVYDKGQAVGAAVTGFMTKVYGWMCLGLLITAFVAWAVAATPAVVNFIFGHSMVFFGLIIGELVLVYAVTAGLSRFSTPIVAFLFVLYAAVNGLTLSAIFLVYDLGTIASTFFTCAATFGLMSVYGLVTKHDLSSWGKLLYMALIGLVIATLVNIFWVNSGLYWLVTYAGVLIFVGLTAYDTQKLKNLALHIDDSDTAAKLSIRGALSLYLDFINLFLFLLRIFGRRR
jgi:FtsH-binding integral membrane protein